MLNGAVAGLGRMGKIHAKNLRSHPYVNLRAVCSPDENHCAWAIDQLGEVDTYVDLDTMIKTCELDFIFLITPSHLHVAQIEKCLQQGLHIFCEKPLAIDVEGCNKLNQLQKAFPSLNIMSGYMRRFDPSYIQMHEVVSQGRIGRPILFRSYSADAESTIAEYLPYAAHSSGHFLDMSIHDIDLMSWMLNDLPTQVTALGGTFLHGELKPHGGDNAAALFQMTSGTMVFLYTGRTASHGYQVETEIIGTKGSVRVGNGPSQNLVEFISADGRTEKYAQDFTVRFDVAFRHELNYFIKQLLSQNSCEPSVRESNLATRIALFAERAFKTKKTILWDE